MPLNPEKLGLSMMNRIVIGEHLTETNAKIFRLAHQMKRDSKVAQVFTEDGLVKIRLKKGVHEPTHVIRTVVEIETMVSRNELQLATHDVSHTHSNAQPAETTNTALTVNRHARNEGTAQTPTNPTNSNDTQAMSNITTQSNGNANVLMNQQTEQQIGTVDTINNGNSMEFEQTAVTHQQQQLFEQHHNCSQILKYRFIEYS